MAQEDALDFLNNEVVEQPVEPVAEAPGEPVQEQPQEPAPVPAEPAKPEPVMVPLAALHEVRDEVKTLRAKLAEADKPAPVEAPPAPDMFADPEGYEAYQARQAAFMATNVKLDLSEDLAREKHGDELVNQAQQWAAQRFQADPVLAQRITSDRNPYKALIAEYQRDQMVSQVTPDDWSQFQAWKAAQAQAQTAAPVAATPVQPVAAPPRSIAAAPSAGGQSHVALGDEALFNDIFKK